MDCIAIARVPGQRQCEFGNVHNQRGRTVEHRADARDRAAARRHRVHRSNHDLLGFNQVLNCFSYTGGFTVAALAGLRDYTGSNVRQLACVTSIDSSAVALEKAALNVRLNGFDASLQRWMDADVNASLRVFAAQGERFDAIVLDPPKFAPTVAHAERAARAYKDINRLALKLLAPGGVLFTFSCSGGISADLFHKIIASAGADAGVDGYVAERLGAAPDHPMTLEFPEGEYLKGLVVLVK